MNSLRILSIDIETAGIVDEPKAALKPETGCIIEIGACLWSYDASGASEIMTFSVIVKPIMQYFLPGISPGLQNDLVDYGLYIHDSQDILRKLIAQSDAVAAHNTSFEKSFLMPAYNSLVWQAPWIDTMLDLPDYKFGDKWPKLMDLATKYNLSYPIRHRALPDARVTAQILACQPWEWLQAKVTEKREQINGGMPD